MKAAEFYFQERAHDLTLLHLRFCSSTDDDCFLSALA